LYACLLRNASSARTWSSIAFLNRHAYKSSSTSFQEALTLPEQPQHLPALAAIATDGAYTDHARVGAVVQAVFAELTALLQAEGAALAISEQLLLPPATGRRAR